MESFLFSSVCRRCRKDITTEPCQVIEGHTFCLECACLPENTALDGRGCRFRFYYSADDLQGEYAYWNDAVERADAGRRGGTSAACDENAKLLNLVMICTTEDPEHAADYAYEWDMCMRILFNKETVTWYFELREEYPSEGDAACSYRGGRITAGEAREYLHRMENHDYDYVFESN